MVILMALAEGGYSQNVNWRSLGEDKRNVVQFNFGYEYGVTARVGYGRMFDIVKPVLFGVEYSVPMGDDLLGDFKVKLGAQVEIVELGGFSATVKIQSNVRRYENALVRIWSFGSDFAVVTGYYSPSWHLAGELGFDKSITSNLKHSAIMKSSFPAIQDGWYIPSGGQFYYGIQGGKTLGEIFDISLRVGATEAQANDDNAVLPYYAQLGLGLRF